MQKLLIIPSILFLLLALWATIGTIKIIKHTRNKKFHFYYRELSAALLLYIITYLTFMVYIKMNF